MENKLEDRKVLNFKKFIDNKDLEKEELKRLKNSFIKNELEIVKKQRKYRYNQLTNKLDDLSEIEFDDLILTYNEKCVYDDIVSIININESKGLSESTFKKIKDKLYSYVKKGLMTGTIMTSVLGVPGLSNAQQNEIKNLYEEEYKVLKEFEVSEMPTPEVSVLQANIQFPEDALILVYSSIRGLNFRSSLGTIDKVSFNPTANRYEILVKPLRQMVFVYHSDFMEKKISTIDPPPKDVIYYKVSVKDDQKDLNLRSQIEKEFEEKYKTKIDSIKKSQEEWEDWIYDRFEELLKQKFDEYESKRKFKKFWKEWSDEIKSDMSNNKKSDNMNHKNLPIKWSDPVSISDSDTHALPAGDWSAPRRKSGLLIYK